MTKGIIISKETQTVQASSDKQYVSTKTPLFKLFKTVTDSRVYSSRNLNFPGDQFTIPHNLGYIPMFFLYADRSPFGTRKIVLSLDTSYPENIVLWTCTADSKNINIIVTGGTSVTGTFGYNCFIFYDKVG